MRDPKTGHGSKNFNEFNAAMERLRKAVPKMIIQIGGSDDIKGTSFEHPAMQAAYQNMVCDGTPEFYLDHLKRPRAKQIQPFFQMAHIHQLEEVEHLIRQGVYMGPLNHALVAIGGGGCAGRNPFDFMEYLRRSPHGSIFSIESLWRTVASSPSS